MTKAGTPPTVVRWWAGVPACTRSRRALGSASGPMASADVNHWLELLIRANDWLGGFSAASTSGTVVSEPVSRSRTKFASTYACRVAVRSRWSMRIVRAAR